MMKRTEMKHTFDENTLSDLYKDARGYRPRSESFWASWSEATNDGKQVIWDNLVDEMVQRGEEEAAREQACVEEFKAQITKVIEAGAGDRATALRWITCSDTFHHSQDVEHWVYNQGILFTDYGRELVKELIDCVFEQR